jgi:hypothetical protein
MPGDFDERMAYLEEQVGHGDITAGCDVDQAYAQNQHENRTFHHNVGRSHYLGDPLMANAFNFVDGMARAVITEEGSRIRDEMQDIAEDMAQFVFRNAPRDPDIGDVLANSGSPFVEDDGIETYRRPPVAPRRMGDDHSNW